MKKDLISDINIYPSDLSKDRYIAFDFYSPDLSKSVIGGIEDIFKYGVQTITGKSTITSSISKTADTLMGGVNTGSKIIKSQFSKRFNINSDSSISGDVSTSKIEENMKSYRGSIFMPLTNGITESISNSYAEERGAVSSLLDSVVGSDSMANKIMGGMAKFTGTRSIISNPDLVQTYKGASNRSIILAWTLMPNSKDEAEKILKILRLFKKYSAPELQAANALLLAPYFCKVTINNKILDETLRYEEMVIESIQSDIGSSGAMELFWDGMPKEININIKLLERRMKTMEDWEEEDNRIQRKGDPLKPPLLDDGFGETVSTEQYLSNSEFY